jgi:hypothetical protein
MFGKVEEEESSEFVIVQMTMMSLLHKLTGLVAFVEQNATEFLQA